LVWLLTGSSGIHIMKVGCFFANIMNELLRVLLAIFMPESTSVNSIYAGMAA